MSPHEIIRAAYNGTIPDGMRMPEKLLYERAKNICMRYGLGILSAADATQLKTEILREYRGDQVQYDNLIDSQMRQAKLWKDIELTATAYINEHSLDAADKLIKRLYNL